MTPLLSPLRFLAIRHGRWVRYNFVIPGVISVAATALYLSWPSSIPLFGENGGLDKLQSPMAIVGGFFIAALTLITADQGEVLRAKVGGEDPPRLGNEVLSRRRFLAFLFGFLSLSSLSLAFACVAANLLAPGFSQLVVEGWQLSVKASGVMLLSFWIAHLGTATLLGLYYFTERLQVSDRRVSIGRTDASAKPLE